TSVVELSWVRDRGSRAGLPKRLRKARRNPASCESAPLEESAFSGLSLECTVFNDDVPARQDDLRHTTDFPSFVCAVIDAHMMCGCTDDVLALGIEDHDVGVRSDSNRALLRKETKDFCG